MAAKQPPKLKKVRQTRTQGMSASQQRKAAQKESALLLAEHVYAYKLIARGVGSDGKCHYAASITDDTLAAWRKNDKDFSVELEKSRNLFLQKRIKLARPEFLLERLEPELFKERKDITSGDKPIPSALVEFIGDDTKTDSQG